MVLRLTSDQASVGIDPTLGASVLSYALSDGRQILRRADDPKDGFSAACYLLAPWCNRLDGGITLADGTFTPVAPTHPAHPLPIHGSAALSEWQVDAKTPNSATLSMACDWPKPFHYNARVQYALTGAALQIALSVQHLGAATLPYGLGIHPWFRRTAQTRLRATASEWQRTDARQIPVEHVDLIETPARDFNALRALPDDLIDTAFGGWNGRAYLEIDETLSVDITTDPPMQHYQVYSTSSNADFVCFEPVSHPVNAHNMPGHPGLVCPNTGQSTSISITITPRLSI